MRQSSAITVIYPGSFDPITLGHLDIIERAQKLFGGLIVAVADPLGKKTLFSIRERIKLVKEATKHLEDVKVMRLEGLLADFARRHKAKAIVRGLREVSDFEYEFKMAWMNRRLYKGLEVLFLVPSEEYAYLSSSLVKEIALLGGDIKELVPECVVKSLMKVHGKENKKSQPIEPE